MALRFVTSPYTEPSGDFFRPALINPTGGTATGRSFTINVSTQARIVPGTPVLFELSGFTGFAVSEVTSPVTAEDPARHDLFIYYDFDDPGVFSSSLQAPSEWKNRNIQQGKEAVYAWPAAGTYTVTVLVIDRNGNWARETTTVTVAALQATYPGIRTILVDPDNIGDNTTYPSSQVVTSIAAAVSRLISLAPSTGCILLRRGRTFNISSTITLDDPLVNWHADAYGSGAKPVVTMTRQNSGSGYAAFSYGNANNVTDSVWANWRFEGTWDAATETGDPRWTPVSYAIHNRAGWKSGMFRVEIEGYQALRPWNGENIAMQSYLIDCTFSNWQDYGVHFTGGPTLTYPRTKKAGVVGCAIHQAQNACNGLGGKTHIFAADHGPLRYVDAMTFILYGCSFYSHNSWVGAYQPCVRMAQSGNGTPTGGYYINAHRIVCIGSGWGIDGQNTSAPSIPGSHLVDGFICINSEANEFPAIIGYGGTTVRNGLIVRRAHGTVLGPATLGAYIDFDPDNQQVGDADSRMDVHNISVINLTTTNAAFSIDSSRYNNVQMQNNVIHQPNLGAPSIPDAPIDLTSLFSEITLYSPGRRRGHNHDAFAIATTASGATLIAPYPSGLTRADVVEAGFHGIQVGSSYYWNDTDNIAFTLTDTEVRIANTTGSTWSGTARLALECTVDFLTDAGYEPVTTTVPVGRQQTGSAAIDSASGLKSYADGFGNIRGTTWDRGFWEGVA